MMGESQGLSEVWETVPNESQESAEVWETVPNGDLGSSEAWETETNESQRSFGSGETASNESQGSFGSWETAPNESQGSFGAWGTAPNESVSRTLGGNGERNGSDGWISAEGEGEPLGVAVSEEMSGIEEIVELQDLPEFHKPQESQGKKARRFLFGRK